MPGSDGGEGSALHSPDHTRELLDFSSGGQRWKPDVVLRAVTVTCVVVAVAVVAVLAYREAMRPASSVELRDSYVGLSVGGGIGAVYQVPRESDASLWPVSPPNCRPLAAVVLTPDWPIGAVEGVSDLATSPEAPVQLVSFRFNQERQAQRAFNEVRLASNMCRWISVSQPENLKLRVSTMKATVNTADEAMGIEMITEGHRLTITIARLRNVLTWQSTSTVVTGQTPKTSLIDDQLGNLRGSL